MGLFIHFVIHNIKKNVERNGNFWKLFLIRLNNDYTNHNIILGVAEKNMNCQDEKGKEQENYRNYAAIAVWNSNYNLNYSVRPFIYRCWPVWIKIGDDIYGVSSCEFALIVI